MIIYLQFLEERKKETQMQEIADYSITNQPPLRENPSLMVYALSVQGFPQGGTSYPQFPQLYPQKMGSYPQFRPSYPQIWELSTALSTGVSCWRVRQQRTSGQRERAPSRGPFPFAYSISTAALACVSVGYRPISSATGNSRQALHVPAESRFT